MNLAIVIPAFNRVAALERLLRSLEAAEVPAGTPLVIVVDCAREEHHRPGNRAVVQLANTFHWPYGSKEIIIQPEPMGLVGNVFFCGSLASQYEAVILLEDDLIVSRRIVGYAQEALAFYQGDADIAGISLNALWFNGFTHQPFIPMLDDGDVFFLQLSTPQGQVYTAAQWADFAGWMAANDNRVSTEDNVHELFSAFPADDWLAVKAKYLVATDRYYVYPRESLTTNFGEPGTHFNRSTAVFQVSLQQFRREFRFQSLYDCLAVYDGFYEILPSRLDRLTDRFHGISYDVDLYASKAPSQLTAEFTLTTRRCREASSTFGKKLRPMEANIIASIPGEGISLASRPHVDTGRASSRAAQRSNDRYFARQQASSGRGDGDLRRHFRHFFDR